MKKIYLLMLLSLSLSMNAQDINQCGLDDKHMLTDAEAVFFNDAFTEAERNQFNFKGKKVMFIGGSAASHEVPKSEYFNYFKRNKQAQGIFKHLVILTYEEKKLCGYDAFLGFYNKLPINARKVSRKLSKGKFSTYNGLDH